MRRLWWLAALAGCADGTPEPEFNQFTRDAAVEDARPRATDADLPFDQRVRRDAAAPADPIRIEAWPEARILAHGRDGSLLSDADGAVDLEAAHVVTVFGEPEAGQGVITSVVRPRGTVRFADPAAGRRLAYPASVQLPGALAGAESYDITLGCVGVRIFDATAPFDANVPQGCLTADGIAWVLALALDAQDRPLAFTHGRIVAAPEAPVQLGPWRMDFSRRTVDVDGEADAHALWMRERIVYGILGRMGGAGPRAFDLAADFGSTHWRAEAVVALADPPVRAVLRAWVAKDAERIRLETDGLGEVTAERIDGALRWTAPPAAQGVRIDARWSADEVERRWTILAPADLDGLVPPTAGIPREWRPPEDATWSLTATACPPIEGAICPEDAPATPEVTPHQGWRLGIGL